MSDESPKPKSNYLPFGIIAGMGVGGLVYGLTQYAPAIALGALAGLIVGVAADAFLARKR
jgi:hypothetical protein